MSGARPHFCSVFRSLLELLKHSAHDLDVDAVFDPDTAMAAGIGLAVSGKVAILGISAWSARKLLVEPKSR
jgi:hypothetical protein